MSEPTKRGARLIVSFELADVGKQEGRYTPELTIEELLAAMEEYTRVARGRTGTYDEEISNAFLCVVDIAVATAARDAILALFQEQDARLKALEEEKGVLEERIGAADGDDVPF